MVYNNLFKDVQDFFTENEYFPEIGSIPPVKYNEADRSVDVHQIDGRMVNMVKGQTLEIVSETKDDVVVRGLMVRE
jgi:hypothetical protein